MRPSEVLRIVVYANPIHIGNEVSWDIDNRYYRLGIRLSEIISVALGFQYEILTPLDGQFGRRLSNGSWTGMVGMVYRGEADLVVSELAITDARSKVLDFSYPFTITDVTFVTNKPERISDITSLFEPFDWEVWSLYAVFHIAMPFIFYMVTQGSHTLSKIALDTFSTFFGQQVFKKFRKPTEKFLVIIWMFSMMIVSIYYKANLLSILTFPILRGVSIIPELSAEVQKGTYDCVTYPGSYYAESMLQSDIEFWHVIGNNLQEKEGSAEIEEVLLSTGPKTPAYIGPEPDFMHLNRKHFISEDLFFTEMAAIGIRKDFCCKGRLNTMIHDIFASGLYEKILKEERFFKILQNVSDLAVVSGQEARALSFTDVRSVFFFSLIGYVFAILCFFLELIIGRNRSKHSVIQQNNRFRRKNENRRSSSRKDRTSITRKSLKHPEYAKKSKVRDMKTYKSFDEKKHICFELQK